MSEHGSGDFVATHTSGSLKYARVEDTEESTVHNLEVEVDVDLDTSGNGSGGGKGHQRKKTIEERARVLGAGEFSQVATTSTTPTTQTAPTYPQVYISTPQTVQTVQQNVQPANAEHVFSVENASMLPEIQNGRVDPNDPWIKAGSLKAFENEQVLLRRAGVLTDVVQAYKLVSFVMLTNRRVVIKQCSSVFNMNLFTVESSFLYENLHHISIERVTNFKFLWGGLSGVLLAILFWAFSASLWLFPVLGVISFLGGAFAIYWFFIFYNSNSVVIDFSKTALVGTWLIPKGKGACITKRLILGINQCFDVMYTIYDQAKTVYAENNT